MSMGSEVYTPWPISARSQRKVMLLSVPMRSQALVSMTFVFAARFRRLLAGGQADGDDQAAHERAARQG